MSPFVAYAGLVALVAIQRLLELRRARRHEAALRLRGAFEFGSEHYGWMKLVHTTWLIACLVEGYIGREYAPIGTKVFWISLILLALGQVLRLLAMAHLGERWTTRVLVLPGESLVSRGIYRVCPHPNYVGVVLEIAALPLVFGCYTTAIVFTLANALLLFVRLQVENRALRVHARGERILIVGGGPVGLMTAICLAEQGFAPTVIDRQSWPIDKSCGEGLMPSGWECLARHGVSTHIQKQFAFDRVTFIDSSRDHPTLTATVSFGGGRQARGIRRTDLSQALWDRARSFPQIELREHTRLMSMQTGADGGSAQVHTDGSSSNSNSVIAFDWIIAADGLHSTVRNKAKISTSRLGNQRRMGVRQHFHVKHGFETVHVFWGEGYEFYVTPLSGDEMQVAALYDQEYVQKRGQDSQVLFWTLMEDFPNLFALCRSGVTSSQLRAYGPLGVYSECAINERVILVGDALGFADGITAEGLALGLGQAELVGEFFAGQFDRRILEEKLLHSRRFNTLLTRFLLFLSRHRLCRRFVFRIAGRCPIAVPL